MRAKSNRQLLGMVSLLN